MKKHKLRLTLIITNFIIVFLLLFFPLIKKITIGKYSYSNGVTILDYRIKSLPDPLILLKIKNSTKEDLIPVVQIEIKRGEEKVKARFNNLEALAPEEVKELEINIADQWKSIELPKVRIEIFSLDGKLLAKAEGRFVASSLSDVKKALIAVSGFIGFLAGSTFLVRRLVFATLS